jgi:menaquinone-9 beta-reductase
MSGPAPGRGDRPADATAPDAADVLIAGAGPAGSVLAFLLAGLGWRVELLDRARFPRAKPCGECLSPGAVTALERLGLLAPVLHLSPAPLGGWRIRTGEGAAAIGRYGPAYRDGLGVSRKALDHALVRQAVARGVRLEEGTRVLRVEAGEEGAAPLLETIDEGGRRRLRTARVVVGADGLRSVVARRLGMVRPDPELRKISLTCRLRGEGPPRDTGLLYIGDSGTVGLAPVEDPDGVERSREEHSGVGHSGGGHSGGGHSSAGRFWNGTVVVNAVRGPELKGNAEGFFRSAFAEAGIGWRSGFDVVDGPWPCGPFDWPARCVSGSGLLLVGDAAGYYDPLTGQGIYRALRTAELAAPAIDRALRNAQESERALKEYGIRLDRAFRPGRRLQRLIEGVLSRHQLREVFVKKIGSTPGGLDALIRVTGDVAPARSLLSPSLVLAFAGAPILRDGRDPA